MFPQRANYLQVVCSSVVVKGISFPERPSLRTIQVGKDWYLLYCHRHINQLKVEVSEMNNLSHEKKTSNTLKADRKVHRVTVNPNKASAVEFLHIPVPKLDDGVVLVSVTLALIFNLTVSGCANSFMVNNVVSVLVDRFAIRSYSQ